MLSNIAVFYFMVQCALHCVSCGIGTLLPELTVVSKEYPMVLRFNSPADTTPRDGSHGSAPEAQPHVRNPASLDLNRERL